ncbi:MAG: hypothetical protein RL113_327 [Pseudomonadota bacterium]
MKIALSLSGGGLRAAAHAGALKFLREQNVEIAAVSGSSAGAIVALMIANGESAENILDFLHDLSKKDLFRLTRNPGLFTLKKLEKKLKQHIGDKTYGQLQIPFYSCVTDINSGESVYLCDGDPILNTIASSSLTPIFEAKMLENGKLYVDGGLSDNLPVTPLKTFQEKILAINVNPLVGGDPKGFKSLFIRTILIMLNANVKPAREIADGYLDIEGVARMQLFDFDEIDNAFRIGYETIAGQWDELKQKLV